MVGADSVAARLERNMEVDSSIENLANQGYVIDLP
jgi:hypothetical protein